jgi:peptidyl-prolyl cis-trans isomerase SurA
MILIARSRLFRTLLACAAFIAVSGAIPARAQTVAVLVNGEPITTMDIDQRIKLTTLSTQKTPSRQQVIEELIDEKVKIKEAKKYGVDPSGSDIDQSFASMGTRMRLAPDQLAKSLEAKGIRPETLKAKIRADMVWSSLVRGRYKDSLLVGERDVQSAIEVKGGDAKQEGESFEYQLRPIVLVVPRGAGAPVIEQRKKEAEALRGRISSCEEAENLFRSMPSGTMRSTITKTSADLPQALRELLDKTGVGRLTAPEVTRQGIEMVALCGRKVTTADTPAKRAIREKMYTEKYEAKSKSYLRDIRKQAMIEYR